MKLPESETRRSSWTTRKIIKSVAIGALGLVLLIGTLAAISLYEYRTNKIAHTIGSLLADTNGQRMAVGSLWSKLQSRDEVQKSLEVPIAISESDDGLPIAVATGSYGMRRIPKDGPPGYVGVWRIPLNDQNQRQLSDIVESLRVYRWGLNLLDGIELPDVRYRTRAKREVESLYRQIGKIEISEFGVADSVMSPEALDNQVAEEIMKEMVERLKSEEMESIRKEFEKGSVGQIYIYQGLGHYRGELVFQDNGDPKITFNLDPAYLQTILDIPMEANQ